jgi:hypothetical protein
MEGNKASFTQQPKSFHSNATPNVILDSYRITPTTPRSDKKRISPLPSASLLRLLHKPSSQLHHWQIHYWKPGSKSFTDLVYTKNKGVIFLLLSNPKFVHATMSSFLKKFKSKTAHASASNHTVTTEFIASNTHAFASVEDPSVFRFRHKFSAMQPQPTLIPRSSTSSGNTTKTLESAAHTETPATSINSLLPPADPQLYHKAKSVLGARPSIVSTEIGQEYHGMWCKTKKLVKGFFKTKDNKNTPNKPTSFDEITECEHKFRHGRCMRYTVYEHETSESTTVFIHGSGSTTPETPQNQNQIPGMSMETMIRYVNDEIPARPILETPLPQTSNGMGIETLIRNIIPMGMLTPIPNVVTAVPRMDMGMPTLLRTLDAAIGGNMNDISPCPPQIGVSSPSLSFFEASNANII